MKEKQIFIFQTNIENCFEFIELNEKLKDDFIDSKPFKSSLLLL